MKNIKKKGILFFVVAGLISSFTIGVCADNIIKNVSAQMNYALKMKYNGVEYNPIETDGSAIRPLTYNGRTYLPVRAIAEKLGVAVDFDDKTSTILIGEKDKVTDLKDIITNKYWVDYTVDADMLFVKGETFKSGLVFEANSTRANVVLNTKAKYQKLGFKYVTESTNTKFTVKNVDTDTILKTIEMSTDGASKDIEVDIGGAKNIELQCDKDYINSKERLKGVVANLYLK